MELDQFTHVREVQNLIKVTQLINGRAATQAAPALNCLLIQ